VTRRWMIFSAVQEPAGLLGTSAAIMLLGSIVRCRSETDMDRAPVSMVRRCQPYSGPVVCHASRKSRQHIMAVSTFVLCVMVT
jgi:hypothetical protein